MIATKFNFMIPVKSYLKTIKKSFKLVLGDILMFSKRRPLKLRREGYVS